ncbi:MAG: hypothetical protein HYS87_03425 [Candidatus Colwellbacteria bacterium]|nr:hypothetical protein [Candidatus Colwellbacteria bacterium]
MTVIQPNKNKNSLKGILYLFALIFVGFLVAEIWVYSETTSLAHEIAMQGEEIEEAKLDIAEAQNALSYILSQENMERLAIDNGFIKDKNPTWVFASER